jgi:hypothetical protein
MILKNNHMLLVESNCTQLPSNNKHIKDIAFLIFYTAVWNGHAQKWYILTVSKRPGTSIK